ncbi:hypothetical protein WJX77_011184 [Trebouxia sp. C0004]
MCRHPTRCAALDNSFLTVMLALLDDLEHGQQAEVPSAIMNKTGRLRSLAETLHQSMCSIPCTDAHTQRLVPVFYCYNLLLASTQRRHGGTESVRGCCYPVWWQVSLGLLAHLSSISLAALLLLQAGALGALPEALFPLADGVLSALTDGLQNYEVQTW